MCGIAGIISHHPSQVSIERLRAGVACLKHRGPQGEGTWINTANQVALGHQRLSIIDLSASAAQPMPFASRYTIVHNGEIYNYLELQKELQQLGYTFRTASDTEVILAAYDAWNVSCLSRMNGMFAFAIWDEQQKKLFAARDRFGEKPFYFFYDEGQLLFASEMKSLWSMGAPRNVNRALLYNFLTTGYTSNPADPQESFFEGILQLPPASYLTYDLQEDVLIQEKYWQVYMETHHQVTDDEALQQMESLFSASVRERLRSDVPVGTSLSGGLDSSSIVAFCEETAAAPYSHQCFTAVFEGFEKDESRFADTVARRFGLKQHKVEISEEAIPSLMERVMRSQEVPFSSASVLAQYKVYEAARQAGVTVLLDGQGADELLAGYHHYYKWYWSELYRNKKLKSSGEQEAARALGVDVNFTLQEKIAALLPQFSGSLAEAIRSRKAFRQPDLNRDFAFRHKQQLYYTLPATMDLNGVLYFNSFVHGLEELLRLADRNSMAHGIEVRLPFLSHQLAEFLFTLPPQMKIRNGWTKWLLRKMTENKLPEEIVWRKDKTGFEPPQKKWMEHPSVREAIHEGKRILVKQDILNPEVLKKNQPHSSYAAGGMDWKYWSASYLFRD